MQLFSPRTYEYSLNSGPRVSIFLLAIVAPILFVTSQSVRLAVVDALSRSAELPELHWALWLDPENPKIHKQIALSLCYQEPPNMLEGVKHLWRATELNPAGANYWYTLASACELASDNDCAEHAYERAIALAPAMPHFEWAAANHYLARDRLDLAFAHFQRLLDLDRGYDWATFRLCLRFTGDPELVFKHLLKPGKGTNLKLDYVNFLSTEGEADSAYRAWKETIADASSFPLSSAEPYLENLIALGRGQEAWTVWSDLKRLGLVSASTADKSDNLLFNGDFEQLPLNAGLDWRSQSPPYIALDFSDPTAYQGKRSLRVDFTVSRNDDYSLVSQMVPVASNHEYLLRAYTRSKNITSDSGPRLRVVDTACPSCLNVSGDTTVGTTPWHEINFRFSTGPQTQLLVLSLVRTRGRSFPTKISGSFWLDAVSLKDLGPKNNEVASGFAP